jgi:hypothetical protein
MIFDTDKLIIVCYPANAGGKFLINCLGLSDVSVFQDGTLVTQQLNGLFTQQDKINLLLQRLDETTDEWNDLGLGCGQLFGTDNLLYLCEYPDLIRLREFPECINSLINLNKHYFFIVAHNTIFLEGYLNIWKNAKVIIFENPKEFIVNRLPDKWENFRVIDWPLMPPLSRDDLILYPQNIIDEIDLAFPNWEYDLQFFQIYKQKFSEFKDNFTGTVISWDTNWYFSAEQTVAEIKKLYETLNLDGFNPDIILNYYHAWQNKLIELKSKQ